MCRLALMQAHNHSYAVNALSINTPRQARKYYSKRSGSKQPTAFLGRR